LERSRQWAVRCVHEGQMNQDNCFVTLTYDDDHIPYGATLHKPDYQKFLKRLRKAVGKYRYALCGEYGDETQRPHYHALLFGYRPDDPELFSTRGENRMYTSKKLSKIWGMGHATFGELTFESAAYCARYCTKKITGENAWEHYASVDPDTGEIFERVPEFWAPSRRPGIGLDWLKKYGKDAYEKDEVVLRAKAMKPPRFYDTHMEVTDPQLWWTVRRKRRQSAFLKYDPVNIDPDAHHSRRLYSGQIIAEKRLQQRENMQ